MSSVESRACEIHIFAQEQHGDLEQDVADEEGRQADVVVIAFQAKVLLEPCESGVSAGGGVTKALQKLAKRTC
jgi:uncharacterized protein (DUF488 family)